MLDLLGMIGSLARPRLLVSAARLGVGRYDRDRHLARLLGGARPPRAGSAILRLLDLEAGHESLRRQGDAAYAPARHVEVLIALLGEARFLRGTLPAPRLVA